MLEKHAKKSKFVKGVLISLLVAFSLLAVLEGKKLYDSAIKIPEMTVLNKPKNNQRLQLTKIGENAYVLRGVEFDMEIEDPGGINQPEIKDIKIALAYKAQAVGNVEGWRLRIYGWYIVGIFDLELGSITRQDNKIMIKGTFSLKSVMGTRIFTFSREDIKNNCFAVFVFVRDSDGHEVLFIIPVVLAGDGFESIPYSEDPTLAVNSQGGPNIHTLGVADRILGGEAGILAWGVKKIRINGWEYHVLSEGLAILIRGFVGIIEGGGRVVVALPLFVSTFLAIVTTMILIEAIEIARWLRLRRFLVGAYNG